MSHDIDIGDLVIVEDGNIVGIVVQTLTWGSYIDNEVHDIEVCWIDGGQYWCNAEALTIKSKVTVKKPQK